MKSVEWLDREQKNGGVDLGGDLACDYFSFAKYGYVFSVAH